MTDWELMRRHLAGDAGAMETLIRRHIDWVYATAGRAAGCTAADADDVTQAVFLLLTRKAARIAQRGTLAGWLYRTTRWCAANLHKHNRRRERLQEEVVMRAERMESGGIVADRSELLALLDDALQRLGPREKAAVMLRYLGEKTFAETGESMGTTEAAARKRADRGLKKMREYFESKGMILPAEGMGAVIAGAACRAPAATVAGALRVADGGPAAAHVAALVEKARLIATAAKAAVGMGIFAFALGIVGMVVWFNRSGEELARGAPVVAASAPAATIASTQAALPEIVLNAADTDHPTEAEVRTFLKARLARLSNVSVQYTMHTEYAVPAGGWPKIAAPPTDAGPPVMLFAAPAYMVSMMVSRAEAAQTQWPAIYLFPSGTSDVTKVFSRLDDALRFERHVVKLNPVVPLPGTVREFQNETYTQHDGRIDRDMDGELSAASMTGQFILSLPEPDIETALLLTSYQRSAGRVPPRAVQTPRLLTPAVLDGMTISFPDTRHIIIARNRAERAATSPATTSAGTRAMSPLVEQWTLDREVHFAPVSYLSTNVGLRMTMLDFHAIGGLMIPAKVVAAYATSARSKDANDNWRVDTLEVTDCRIQDSSNTIDRYRLLSDVDAEASMPATPNGGPQGGQNFELFLGAEPLDQASLTHLNVDFGTRAGAHGSPSIPASRDAIGFRAAHERFLALAKEGNIDTLLIGDSFAQHWSDDAALFQTFGEPARTANFGLDGDTVENILWRVTHGEVDHLSPKTIVLFAGNSDAANFGRGGPTVAGNRQRPGIASISFPNGGVEIRWQSREDAADEIAKGLALLVKTLREKCPSARVIVLGVAPRSLSSRPPLMRGNGAAFAPVSGGLRGGARVASINDALAKLELGAEFVDLSKATLEADGTLSADAYNSDGTPTAEVYKRWSGVLRPLLSAQK